MAMKESIKEAIYISNIFNYINTKMNLGYIHNTPLILEDNQYAIRLGQNPEFHKRSKHIDIQYHFIRKAISDETIRVVYIPTKD